MERCGPAQLPCSWGPYPYWARGAGGEAGGHSAASATHDLAVTRLVRRAAAQSWGFLNEYRGFRPFRARYPNAEEVVEALESRLLSTLTLWTWCKFLDC